MKVEDLEFEMESNNNNNNNNSKEAAVEKTNTNRQRRPDIDVIRIVLTWGILLYHTVLIYSQPWAGYYVKIEPDQIPVWHLIGNWLTISMDVWQMPMFFFLSGIR